MSFGEKINNFLNINFGVRVKRVPKNYNAHLKSVPSWLPKRDLDSFNIDKYLTDLEAMFINSLQHPDFISTKGKSKPIHAEVNQPVRAIRLELPTKRCLHLHSLVLHGADDKPIDNFSSVSVYTSSNHPLHDTLSPNEHKDRLFNPGGNHSYAFHTKSQKKPWVLITFPDETFVSNITITNRLTYSDPREHIAQKTIGLRVLVTKNFKDWSLKYDLGGIVNFNSLSADLANKYKLYTYSGGEFVYLFTKSLLQDGKLTARTAYKKIPSQYRAAIKSSVNKFILNDRGMEYTSHGIRRSFRFWSLDEKKTYLQETNKLIDDLKKLSPDVCLGFGSVIATVRDKDFLPHDDDTDLIIAFKRSTATTFKQALDILEEFLLSSGYTPIERKTNLCKVMSNGFKVDIFVGIYDKDRTIGWFPGGRGILKRSDVFPAKKSSLFDIDCLIPKNYDKYLQSIYGEGWSNPDPNFKHVWSNRAQYQEFFD